jgi:thymidine kinase
MCERYPSQANINVNKAYLELIIGPMFAGKTSRLIKIYKEYEANNLNIMAINHAFDTRYNKEGEDKSNQNQIIAHNKISIPSINLSKLEDIYMERSLLVRLNEAQVILINEGQFFSDLPEFVFNELANKKQIYICGLDGDFKQNKFGKILDLIPFADKVIKLRANCNKCWVKDTAIFTHRIIENQEQTLVGGSEAYIPICRECHMKI